MKFFYTGSNLKDGWQTDPLKSLGNYVSQNEIPNGLLNNLFSDISLLGERKGYSETKGIVLKNKTGNLVTNVYLFHTYPVSDCKVKLEWGIAPLIDGKMDSLASMRALPYGITFAEPKDVGRRILLASSLAADEMIGLWVKRTIITPPPIDAISPVDLQAYLASLITDENIMVTIEYT